jgi:hypothetical protein
MHTNNILVTAQYDFRKGILNDNTAFIPSVYLLSLTKKCMLEEFSVIKQWLFECVNHVLLLAKLRFCGIPGSYDWFGPYLTIGRQSK